MPTTTQGSSIFQHLSATKKLLQDATIDSRYVWGSEVCHVRGLKMFSGSRQLSTWLRSDERTNRTRGLLQLTRISFSSPFWSKTHSRFSA
jgi:hypothetical protein